ncbi:MAG TPA: aldo/keto reductase [Chthoniobacterales bacterium]|nr:aldo/keto reductase [Chthoniobacterales bacterium]
MKRRDFLRKTALSVGATWAAGELIQNANALVDLNEYRPKEVRKGDMLYRDLGKTGEQVSLVGLGGYHIGHQADENESIKIIRSAIDRGITFMDNCWDYNGGASEIRMGKALQDGYRDKVFLMTKIDGRTEESAAKQIDESLQRLQTDHLDLLQHHEILRMEDPDAVFAPEGSMTAVLAAQKAGKVRHIGFTGHKDPVVHLRMLDVAAQNDFHFDTAQMPLNVMDGNFRSFGQQVLPRALKEGIGVLGMKSMADGFLLRSDTVEPIDCLHYAMSLPVSVVITGIDSMKILDQAVDAVRTFKSLTEFEMSALLQRTRTAAAKGVYEPYKTTSHFDGTARNPQWLGYS